MHKHPTLAQLSGVLSALLAAVLFWKSGMPLLVALWCLTGNSPGGQSDVTIVGVKEGLKGLAVGLALVGVGVICIVWSFKAFRRPKEIPGTK